MEEDTNEEEKDSDFDMNGLADQLGLDDDEGSFCDFAYLYRSMVQKRKKRKKKRQKRKKWSKLNRVKRG